LLDLFEMVTQLDNRGCLEHPVLIDDELAMTKRIDVTLDQEEIGAALDGQEALARYVNSVGIFEVLDRCTSGGLELDDSMAIISGLGVDDDIELYASALHEAFERPQVDPQVVRVENLNLRTDLKSSTCSEGTWAISSKRIEPS